MIIYSVAILAICTLIGQFAGSLLGVVLGVQANVGGVGFAMILLLVVTDYLQRAKKCRQSQRKVLLFGPRCTSL